MNLDEILNPKRDSLILNDIEKAALVKINSTNYYKAGDFSFLNDHKSLRPGKKHLLLGTTGSGKTTLARSICYEIAKEKKVMWYSSEESLDDMRTAISINAVNNKSLENVDFREEQDYIKKTNGDSLKFISEIVKDFIQGGCEVMFFDNLTTSAFYEGKQIDQQAAFFNMLSEVFKKIKKPIFIIAHTDAKTKDLQKDLFDANSIRGQKLPSNKCEYVYGYQIIPWIEEHSENLYDFTRGEQKSAFVRVLKSRGHPTSGNIYALNYEEKTRSYANDLKIDFNDFVKIYSKRVRLK
jgi:KaiC/GvpD/RAD55 family RecA-like ATPase